MTKETVTLVLVIVVGGFALIQLLLLLGVGLMDLFVLVMGGDKPVSLGRLQHQLGARISPSNMMSLPGEQTAHQGSSATSTPSSHNRPDEDHQL